MSTLLDESCTPSLRSVIGDLLARSTAVDVAVARINVAALDMQPAELLAVRRMRLIVGTLDARSMPRDAALGPVLQLIEQGRLHIRSAGMCDWSPDFSCYAGEGMDSALVGAHYFRSPLAGNGPSFTCVLSDPAALTRLRERFEMLWNRGYDVRDAVVGLVRPA